MNVLTMLQVLTYSCFHINIYAVFSWSLPQQAMMIQTSRIVKWYTDLSKQNNFTKVWRILTKNNRI